jgi:hypothetical protein
MKNTPSRLRQRGQSIVEYVIVTSMAVLVLIQTQGSEGSVIQTLATAIKDVYRGFTYSLSYATNLTIF